MPIEPGTMTERITLERLDDPTQEWAPIRFPTMWAAGEPQGDAGFRFRIRYRDDLRTKADLEPALRVKYPAEGGEYYDVIDIVIIARRELTDLIVRRRIVEEILNLESGARRVKAWP